MARVMLNVRDSTRRYRPSQYPSEMPQLELVVQTPRDAGGASEV